MDSITHETEFKQVILEFKKISNLGSSLFELCYLNLAF
jgi:hypothetical protein